MEVEKLKIKNTYIVSIEGKRYLATKNLTPGITYYKERLFKTEYGELREWIPYKSKLSAAYLKNMDISILNKANRILYLGMSTGTTVSHVSDILADEGVIFGVEVAPRVMLEYINRVAKFRDNIIPIFYDARRPEEYLYIINGKVDMVYCDVAQPDQTEIAMANSKLYLKKGGELFLAIKARSIDASRDPAEIYRDEVKKLEKNGFKVLETVDLEPYEKDHAMVRARLIRY